ncbi:MAG: hypothetical protein AMXMBFR84_06580 [Candidatus Hydrogenedentota bacterium]
MNGQSAWADRQAFVYSAGFIILGMIIGTVLLTSSFSSNLEPARRSTCQNNMILIALACTQWADANGGLLPPVSSFAGDFTLDPAVEMSGLDGNRTVFSCPNEPHRDGQRIPPVQCHDRSYFYFGYEIANPQQARAFFQAYRKQISVGESFHGDLISQFGARGGSATVRRLRLEPEGDSTPAEIPVLIERPGNHSTGIHVVYLDGHTAYLKMNTRFPAQDWFFQELAKLDR